jgi:hypothetical protein
MKYEYDLITIGLGPAEASGDSGFMTQHKLTEQNAAAENRIEVVKILLARGADPKRQSANGLSALDLARWQADQKLFQLFQSEIER